MPTALTCCIGCAAGTPTCTHAGTSRCANTWSAWGGNASGVNVANIDNLGQVHPDTMWWHHTLGNVRERPFSAIWADCSDPLMAGLKSQPRPVRRPLRVVPALRHLRRQHARARATGHRRCVGRRPGLLSRRRRDRPGTARRSASRVTPFAGRRRIPIASRAMRRRPAMIKVGFAVLAALCAACRRSQPAPAPADAATPPRCTNSTAPPATVRSAPAAWGRRCCPRAWSACACPRR